MSALGVLLALLLAQRTARVAKVNATQVWNLCVIALFAALLDQRLLLIAMNWNDLRLHPKWMLGLAMIHHPLLAGAGALAGLGAAAACTGIGV
jgi:phosphatidylglycerol:prolipoprotein diacylglycerol transferase